MAAVAEAVVTMGLANLTSAPTASLCFQHTPNANLSSSIIILLKTLSLFNLLLLVDLISHRIDVLVNESQCLFVGNRVEDFEV